MTLNQFENNLRDTLRNNFELIVEFDHILCEIIAKYEEICYCHFELCVF